MNQRATRAENENRYEDSLPQYISKTVAVASSQGLHPTEIVHGADLGLLV